MSNVAFQAFEAAARARGYDEVLVREWPPAAVLLDHTHPFGAKAVVVRGEMWLTVGTDTRHLRAGGTFELAAGVVHSERYGPEGATYWVARRSA